MPTTPRILVAFCLATACVPGAGQEVANQGTDLAIPREDWDRAFQRTDGWTGGDVALAVDLDEKRTLWLWGDSWVGSVVAGKHGPNSRLVNNSLALHDTPPAGQAPDPGNIEFFWGIPDEKGRPTAWLTPDASRVKARRSRNATSDPTFYWMASGVAAPGPLGQRRLLLFLWHVGKTGGGGVWNFESVGGALAIVENPDEPVQRWRVTQHGIPHAVPDAARETVLNNRAINWGSALLVVPPEPDKADGTPGNRRTASPPESAPWLYIFGTRSVIWGSELVLARAPCDCPEDFSRWEFRAANAWSPRLDEARGLAGGMVSEFTVSRIELGGRGRFLLIQSEPFFGIRILARVSESPSGPWTDAVPIYHVPGVDPKRKYFTYAAKAHPHLSPPGKLLVTYIINSHNFWNMVGDANIYRPRFIEVDLPALAAKLPPTTSGRP